MTAITPLDNELLMLLERDPQEYHNRILSLKTSDLSLFYKHINAYDADCAHFYGGNPLHCLSMIQNSSTGVYGSDTHCNSDLAKQIFGTLVMNGCNIYHYDYYGDTPLKSLNICENNREYYEMLREYYRDNPINGEVTICYPIYELYAETIITILNDRDLLRNNLDPDLCNIINDMYESNKRAITDYLVNYCVIAETDKPTITKIRAVLIDAIDTFK